MVKIVKRASKGCNKKRTWSVSSLHICLQPLQRRLTSLYMLLSLPIILQRHRLPPTRIRPFNKLVLDFLDIEAKQSKDRNGHDSPSWWLSLMGLETQARLFKFFKFICFVSIYLFQMPIRLVLFLMLMFDSPCWR